MSVAPLAQSAICPAGHAHALFLAFDLSRAAEATQARAAISALANQLAAWEAEPAAARNCWAIGIGVAAWPNLVGGASPRELLPFPEFADAIYPMPVQSHSLFLHLRSERHDLCFQAGEWALAALAGAFDLAAATPGFRFLDSRDLTGFVDGTENPALDERPDVALVDDDGAFNGGSYLHVQRYVHDLVRWQQLPEATQERVIGRSKPDDVEMDDAIKPATSHIARTVIEEDGEELEIVRQSMPYGVAGGEQGLLFVSYCKTPTRFNRMLENMNTARDGHSDHLLRFSRAVSSAAYFVPPKAMLFSWGR